MQKPGLEQCASPIKWPIWNNILESNIGDKKKCSLIKQDLLCTQPQHVVYLVTLSKNAKVNLTPPLNSLYDVLETSVLDMGVRQTPAAISHFLLSYIFFY